MIPNHPPEDQLSVFLDTKRPVSPELAANLLLAVSRDLREFGFGEVEVVGVERGSIKAAVEARQLKKLQIEELKLKLAASKLDYNIRNLDLEIAKVQSEQAEIEKQTASKKEKSETRTGKIAIVGGVLGLLTAMLVIGSKIVDGDDYTGSAVGEIMMECDASSCTLQVGTEQIVIPREKVGSVVFDESVNELSEDIDPDRNPFKSKNNLSLRYFEEQYAERTAKQAAAEQSNEPISEEKRAFEERRQRWNSSGRLSFTPFTSGLLAREAQRDRPQKIKGIIRRENGLAVVFTEDGQFVLDQSSGQIPIESETSIVVVGYPTYRSEIDGRFVFVPREIKRWL